MARLERHVARSLWARIEAVIVETKADLTEGLGARRVGPGTGSGSTGIEPVPKAPDRMTGRLRERQAQVRFRLIRDNDSDATITVRGHRHWLSQAPL